MKKFMFALMLSIFVSALAFAATEVKKDVKPVKADVETLTVGDITLNVDGDYTWKTVVEDAGLKSGTDEYKTARATCMAWDSLWKQYHEAAKAGTYDVAEKVAPYSVLKGWAAWNSGCQNIGSKQEVEGRGKIYVFDPDAPVEALERSVGDFERAIKYGEAAEKVTVVGMANPAESPAALLKQVKRSLDVVQTMLDTANGKTAPTAPKKVKKDKPAAEPAKK